MGTRVRLGAVLTVAVFCALPVPPVQAAEAHGSGSWLGSVLGLSQTKLTMSDAELQSLGCIIGGAAITVAGIVFGGAAIVASGGRNAATAGKVAVPVIAAATMAGCMVGSSSALGLSWLDRNWNILAGKVVDALPDVPTIKNLPSVP